MIRVLSVVLALLIVWPAPVSAEVKGFALVQVRDPARGSVPDIVTAYGIVESENTLTRSFQRDGQVSNIMVEVGDQFKKGEPLLDFGASPAAVIAYEQAKTALRLAEASLARAEQMLKLKLITRDQVEISEKAVSDAQSTKEMYEKLGSTTSEVIEAPFDGVVVAISVSKGDRVAAGTSLMTLAETARVRLSLGIEPAEMGKMKPGLPVTLESISTGRSPIEAKVKGVGAAIDPSTKLLPLAIELANASVLPGEHLKARILVGKFEGWVVPRDSIGFDKKGAYVFQVDDEHAKKVNVNVVGSDADTSVIEGDIDPQRKIVLSGNYQIADGDALRTQEAPRVSEADTDSRKQEN
jgi:RND family efflux transporter MFP subunit